MSINHTTRYVAMMVQYLESQGFACTQALAQAGMSRRCLTHLDARLSLTQLGEFVLLLEEQSGRPEMHLAAGLQCGPHMYGELGRAILSSATLRDSITLTIRYYPLITNAMSLTMEESRGMAELCWRPITGLPYHLLVGGFEVVLGAFSNRLKLVLGDDLTDYEVHFSTPAPPSVERYRLVRPARCYFGEGGLPTMRLRINSSLLDKRMPLANAAMLQEAEQKTAAWMQLLHAQSFQRDWRAWAEMMLRESIGHQPTLEELAVIANVSPSTLTRNLAAQDCNFRQLGNQIRHERACAMLCAHGMRVSDVSQLLGYTSVGNFIRAFKAQAGLSPTQYVAAEEVALPG